MSAAEEAAIADLDVEEEGLNKAQGTGRVVPDRTTADSVLERVLSEVAGMNNLQPAAQEEDHLNSQPATLTTDTPLLSAVQSHASSRRTTTDSVVDRLVQQAVREAESAQAAQLSTHMPDAEAPRRQEDDSQGADASSSARNDEPASTAAPGNAVLHRDHSTSYQSLPSNAVQAQKRSTADAPSSSMLQRRDSEAASTVPSSVVQVRSQHSTADRTPSNAMQARQQRAMEDALPSNAVQARSQHSTNDILPSNTMQTRQQRSTTDSVLSDVLDDVKDAEQASVDSLLDGVLNEVAGAASCQRTTADNVLDAMLEDLAHSQPTEQLADAGYDAEQPALLNQPQAVRSSLAAHRSHWMH